MRQFFKKAWALYYEGFRDMRLGRALWAIILIKLFIMFVILRIFFFPNMLGGMDHEQKADYVSNELTTRIK